MHIMLIRQSCIAFFFLLSAFLTKAQPSASAFIDAGHSNVSEGLFLKTDIFSTYKYSNYKFQAGMQSEIKSNNTNFLSGLYLSAQRGFTAGKLKLETQCFFTRTSFSGTLRETNWGLILRNKGNHFIFSIGTNFRTYSFSPEAASTYGMDSENNIHENWNVMYTATYNLKPEESKWNAGLTLTNTDYYIIEQESNPVFNINANYWFKQKLNIFMETWYKSSGAFNLSVNYFEFFVRTGVIWKIKEQED